MAVFPADRTDGEAHFGASPDARSVFVRHASADAWCVVVDTTSGSVITRCRGRIALTDSYELHDRVPAVDVCGGCRPQLERGVDDYADVFEVSE